jgi:hypothetical protein
VCAQIQKWSPSLHLTRVLYAIAGWFAFLKQQGAPLPTSFIVCGLPVN